MTDNKLFNADKDQLQSLMIVVTLRLMKLKDAKTVRVPLKPKLPKGFNGIQYTYDPDTEELVFVMDMERGEGEGVANDK
jgi:hypothetical protein